MGSVDDITSPQTKFKYGKCTRPPDKIAYCKLFSLFLIQNICCGYSKEPFQ